MFKYICIYLTIYVCIYICIFNNIYMRQWVIIYSILDADWKKIHRSGAQLSERRASLHITGPETPRTITEHSMVLKGLRGALNRSPLCWEMLICLSDIRWKIFQSGRHTNKGKLSQLWGRDTPTCPPPSNKKKDNNCPCLEGKSVDLWCWEAKAPRAVVKITPVAVTCRRI